MPPKKSPIVLSETELKKVREQLLLSAEFKQLISAEVDKATKDLKEKVRSLEEKLNQLDDHGRRNNIEIAGFPVHPNETEEHCLSALKTLATSVGHPLDTMAILKIHRNGKQRDGDGSQPPRPPTIVAELRNRAVQEKFLQKVKSFYKNKNGVVTAGDLIPGSGDARVFIGRQLSPYTKYLLRRAKKLAKEKGYKFAWVTPTAKVLVRKAEGSRVIPIKHENDLFNIK